MRIDHVIYATADLDAAIKRLENDLGLVAVRGGRHEGFGTHNRIVPLGGGYLELVAVCDREEASSFALAAAWQSRIRYAAEGLMGWAVTDDDVKRVAARLGTEITTITRGDMTARLTGLAESLRRPFLPFFIARDPGVADPGATGDAGGITWIEVSGDAAHLKRWLGGAELPVRVSEGAAGVCGVGIGDLELRVQ